MFFVSKSSNIRCCGRVAGTAEALASPHPLLQLPPPSRCRKFRRCGGGGGGGSAFTIGEIPLSRRRAALFRLFAVGALSGPHRASRQLLGARFTVGPKLLNERPKRTNKEKK